MTPPVRLHPRPRRRGSRGSGGFALRLARGRRRAPKQRGIAILAVVMAIAIAMMLVNEFGSRTTIDIIQSRNTLDQTRTHFLARSALNLGEILLRMQDLLDQDYLRGGPITRLNGGALIQVTSMSDPLMMAFGGDAEQVQKAIGVTSMDDLQGFGADIGQFGLRMVPVDGKINVNCAGTGGASDKKLVASQLKSLFFPFATNSIFDEEDAEGWRRDYETQVEAIIDYIDQDTDKVDVADRPNAKPADPLPQGGAEDYGYENLRDRYQAKNRLLDSVGELRLVRGIDDRMWTLFGNAFRVHGGCKINLRAMEDITVIASVISLSVKDPNDPGLRDPSKIWTLSSLVLQARSLGETFEKADDFATFVKDPVAYFTAGMESATQAGADASALAAIKIPPGFTGIELDPQKLGQFTTTDPARAFQVEAYADMDRGPLLTPLHRTIRGMWDKRAPLQNKRWQGNPNTGAWQWLREE